MNQIKSLVNRLKEVLTEGKWITGTNFKEQIVDVHWEDAILNMHGLNSIADLTFHVNYYIAGLIIVLEGGPLEIRDKYSFDYPAIQSEEEWLNMINKFCVDAEKYIALVESLPEEKLYEFFVDEKYGNVLRNINVIVEHTYYHLGQLVIIKRMIREADNNTDVPSV